MHHNEGSLMIHQTLPFPLRRFWHAHNIDDGRRQIKNVHASKFFSRFKMFSDKESRNGHIFFHHGPVDTLVSSVIGSDDDGILDAGLRGYLLSRGRGKKSILRNDLLVASELY